MNTAYYFKYLETFLGKIILLVYKETQLIDQTTYLLSILQLQKVIYLHQLNIVEKR